MCRQRNHHLLCFAKVSVELIEGSFVYDKFRPITCAFILQYLSAEYCVIVVISKVSDSLIYFSMLIIRLMLSTDSSFEAENNVCVKCI